jgi:uncharacterized protein YqgC (DUF456 family)
METTLAVLGWGAFGLAIVAGLALDLVGLFGNWIILGAVAIAWVATDFAHFSGPVLIVLAILAALGELIEFLASGVGAAKFGASKGAMAAALVGCIAGAILGAPFFLIVGAIVGAVAGAFVGAASYEILMTKKDYESAMRIGFGAAIGKLGGMLGKMAVGVLMVGIAAFSF